MAESTPTRLCTAIVAFGLVCSAAGVTAQPRPAALVIDSNDNGGFVKGPNGPEAGVWVIAETTDLPTKYAKIVVTDDAGRYLLPDLPRATYKVWVRGYGLVDSPRVDGTPGQPLDLSATPALTPADRKSVV